MHFVVKSHPNNSSLNRDLIVSHNQSSGVQKLDDDMETMSQDPLGLFLMLVAHSHYKLIFDKKEEGMKESQQTSTYI